MFDITTSEQFYLMLIEDFDEFMDEPYSTRRALHCAILAYHLHEWVWGGWLKHDAVVRRALGISDKSGFVGWIVQHCVWFQFVQEIVNGTKHFRAARGFETARVAAASSAEFDESTRSAPIRYISGELPVGPQGKGCLILDLGDPAPSDMTDGAENFFSWDDEGEIGEALGLRFLPAAHLLEAVVRFWRDFFRLYRPTADIQSSKHHVL